MNDVKDKDRKYFSWGIPDYLWSVVIGFLMGLLFLSFSTLFVLLNGIKITPIQASNTSLIVLFVSVITMLIIEVLHPSRIKKIYIETEKIEVN